MRDIKNPNRKNNNNNNAGGNSFPTGPGGDGNLFPPGQGPRPNLGVLPSPPSINEFVEPEECEPQKKIQ